MVQNNPAALQALQKEFGAGMTTQGQQNKTAFWGVSSNSCRA